MKAKKRERLALRQRRVQNENNDSTAPLEKEEEFVSI
jgi:hypothetical protein